jgi:hypothetical protein
MLVCAAALTCWFCVFFAVPRARIQADDLLLHAYARYVGQRLSYLAILLTIASVLALALTRSPGEDAALRAVRGPTVACEDRPGSAPICWTYLPGPPAVWLEEQMQGDGSWLTIATMMRRPAAFISPGETPQR